MDDLISRQAAINIVRNRVTKYTTPCALAVTEIQQLPSADPVKHGRWIKMSDADGFYYACSECGEELTRIEKFDSQFDLFPRLKSIDKTHFCSNCGCKMDEEDE